MGKILAWVNAHKTMSILALSALFMLPLVIVHVLYKWSLGCDFWASEWTAGDMIGYIAGFEAFLGTFILGIVAVYQNKQAYKMNAELQKMQQVQFVSMISLSKVYVNVRSKQYPQYMTTGFEHPEIVNMVDDEFPCANCFHIDAVFANESQYPIVQITVLFNDVFHQKLLGGVPVFEHPVYIGAKSTSNIRLIIPYDLHKQTGQTSLIIKVCFTNVFDYTTISTLTFPTVSEDHKESNHTYRLAKFTDVRPK